MTGVREVDTDDWWQRTLSAFGEKLHDLRKDAGLTLVELADRIGVGKSTLSALERGEGKKVPSASVVRVFIDEGIKSWPADTVARNMRHADLLDHYRQLVEWRELADDLPQDRDSSTLPVEPATWDACADLFEHAMTIPDDPLPSMLLRAEYGVVPFAGRETELASLTEWLAVADRVSVRLVTGPGGEGKTRLAGELIRRTLADRWVAGFLAEEVPAGMLATPKHLPAPLLLVVDYADGRTDQLREFAATLAERTVGQPVRILLLARSAGSWQSLLRGRDDRVARLFAGVPEHRLRPLTDEVDRREEFDRAVRAFSVAHDRQVAGPVAVPPDLDDERYERALDIHAAALASLLDLEVPGTPTVWNDPIMRVRDHEERYWLATTDAYALTEPHLARLREAVSAATLFGAADADVARTLLAGLPTFADFEGDRVERYRRWLAAMYPGESALNPVRPDRLGEDLVAMTLADQANMAAAVSPSLNHAQLVRALTVLGRSASRHAHLRPVMHDLLSAPAADRVPIGMAVATQLEDETLISVLTDISENDPDMAEVVVDHLPDQSLALAVFAVVRTRAALEHERRKPKPDKETLAWLAVRMAIRLGALEETGEALSYAVDAVQRYRDLTTRDPAFEPDLANALNTLAGAFDAADLPEDALNTADDSVRRLRRLSRNLQELRLILSTALMTKSNVLSGLARHEDALTALTEAVDIQRGLLDEHPDEEVPADLGRSCALSLQNLALVRAETGLAPEALDAAEIFRELAEQDPDAFGGELVHCELTVASVYGLLGDWEHAHEASEQAIRLARDLVARHGEAHLGHLAAALSNAGAAAHVLDRPKAGSPTWTKPSRSSGGCWTAGAERPCGDSPMPCRTSVAA